MSLRSQGLRMARALVRELRPAAANRSVSSSAACWRPHRPLVATSCSPSFTSNNNNPLLRGFSTKSEEAPPQPQPEGESASAAADGGDAAAADSPEPPAASEEETKIAELETQVKDLKEKMLRSLAEQENTRRIAQRDVANAKNFAISSFAKSLLDTSDNLSRALDAVPEDLRHDHENHPVLATLYEGIAMTDDGLTKAFAKNGLKKFGAKGEKFDPNLHEALFEYPDPEGEAGNIGQVMKVGFMLNERVVRPAEVGVVKAP